MFGRGRRRFDWYTAMDGDGPAEDHVHTRMLKFHALFATDHAVGHASELKETTHPLSHRPRKVLKEG